MEDKQDFTGEQWFGHTEGNYPKGGLLASSEQSAAASADGQLLLSASPLFKLLKGFTVPF